MPRIPFADGENQDRSSRSAIVQYGNKCLISARCPAVVPVQTAGKFPDVDEGAETLRQKNVCNCGYECNRH
jgi:hypothetical protein